MTSSPHSIGISQSLETARAMMNRYRIRHLPVLELGRLTGVLSQRDVYLIESIPGVNARDTSVEEAMSQDAYCVLPDSRVEDVAREMAEQKYGCAVVMEGSRVRGIFTTTDALRALSEILQLRDKEASKAHGGTAPSRATTRKHSAP